MSEVERLKRRYVRDDLTLTELEARLPEALRRELESSSKDGRGVRGFADHVAGATGEGVVRGTGEPVETTVSQK